MNERFDTLVNMKLKMDEVGLVDEAVTRSLMKDLLNECKFLLKQSRRINREQQHLLAAERKSAKSTVKGA